MLAPLLLVVPVLLVERDLEFLPSVSPWTVAWVLAFAVTVHLAGYVMLPELRTTGQIVARIGSQAIAVSVLVYAFGWGPTLAVALLYDVPDIIRIAGQRAVRVSACSTVTVIAGGQAAIALGWVPSVLDEHLSHGIAILAASGIVFVIMNIGRIEAARQRVESDLRRNEERFRALVQNASDIILVAGTDGVIRYVSPAFERILGFLPGEAIGKRPGDFIHPDDEDSARIAFEALADREGHAVARTETRLRHRNGSWLTFEVHISNLYDYPGVEGSVGNLHDISERVRAEAELRDAEARFRSAFENAPIGMALTGTEGRMFRVNRAMATMFGYEPESMLGLEVSDFVHPDDLPVGQEIRKQVASGEFGPFKGDRRYRHADGHYLWCQVSVSHVTAPDGTPTYMIAQVEDVSERRAMAQRLEHAAIHDPLTGLPNRVLLSDRLEQSLGQARRRNTGIGVVFLDLDQFKFVNDSLGHAAGDELLCILAERVLGAVRPGDTVARFGGDEFVVLCDDIGDVAMVLDVARRIAAAIAAPVMLGPREVFVTASLGVVVSSAADTEPEAILRDADAAMYHAKDAGRDRIEIFDESTRKRAVEHLETATDLHRALERTEFEVHYQPVVALETGRVSGFEALVRWNHPTRGRLLPEEFIHLAEDSGLIVPLGAWVLEEACRQAVDWQAARGGGPSMTMAINLAPRQLAEPGIAADVKAILERTGVDPDSVWLELTEGALMRDAEASTKALQALRDLGVHLAVDDFGTGYSSLAHLKRFPVEQLKVDQTFVAGLGIDVDDTSIVRAVVSLAHSLGLEALAEGLETPLQLSELRTLGCDHAQGYLFGKPRPGSALSDQPADDLSAWHEHATT
jgi:diguanylate cyclase (GGDEF)-like protein/PAS domain S-box-containing protein